MARIDGTGVSTIAVYVGSGLSFSSHHVDITIFDHVTRFMDYFSDGYPVDEIVESELLWSTLRRETQLPSHESKKSRSGGQFEHLALSTFFFSSSSSVSSYNHM